ncbi:(d)CMP kinase [Branchiibius cervicis]|uniref:Cytidylate kinase n=1 Tax=Branchiibius cervicis TaxID=908252 RepID=A0ABW2ARH0_9MICO
MTEGRLIVAIDGPSGTGKSSVSKEVARRLGIGYLDTGAMYRAVAWWAQHEGIDLSDQPAVAQAAETIPLVMGTNPDDPRVSVDDIAIDRQIRTSEISEMVSAVATNLAVRSTMKKRQRRLINEIAEATGGVVAEGRDITTVVAPFADARILMTASEEVRMGRRSKELAVDAEATRAQIVERDAKDSTVAQFLTAADGVVTVDTSDLDFEQSVAAVLGAIEASTSAIAGH